MAERRLSHPDLSEHQNDPGLPIGFSLLWPPGSSGRSEMNTSQLSPAAWRDLSMANLVAAFTSDPEHQRVIGRLFSDLVQDPFVVRYRQDVIEDLRRNPGLGERLEQLLPEIDALGQAQPRVVKDMTTLHEVTWRMGELQSIVNCIEGLAEIFTQVGEELRSQGWQALRAQIIQQQQDPTFHSLVQELPGLLAQLRTCASVTIGVNLDPFLRPVEATLLAVNEDKFTNQSVLNRLFGKRAEGMEGLTPLHSVPRRDVNGPYALPVSSELGWAVEPMMVPLFQDLAQVIEKITKPIARQLKQYNDIKSRLFASLRQDLIFYLGALRLIHRLEAAGLPLCRPTLAKATERLCQVSDTYNVNLAIHRNLALAESNLSDKITFNDIQIGPAGRILILTGPNQGGKTTYMQGVALLQVLAQVGLPVPGRQAEVSPVDNIYTHFPVEEKPEADTGRFGEETRRLSEIFQQVTSSSLVLLNESLASTSAGESLYLAQDIIRILRRIGGRAIYSTHLHELADQTDELNAAVAGESRIISVVSSPIEDGRAAPDDWRSFKIEVRPPIGRSYAKEIAARYGISYEQLEQSLIQRGVLNGKSPASNL